MRKHCTVFTLVAFVLLWAVPSGAIVITLEDFESYAVGATPTTSSGDVSIDDGGFGLGPFDGSSRQAILTTSAGGGAVAPGVTETDLGLPNNRIQRNFDRFIANQGLSTGSGPTEGSAFQITFNALAQDSIQFDWNMLTSEFTATPVEIDRFTDFMWVRIDGPPNRNRVPAHVNDGTAWGASGVGAYANHTGNQTFALTLPTGGSYTITVGVHDVQDAAFDSALMIDFFRLVRGPEPGTFFTVAGGLMALSWLSKRRRL